MKNIRASRIVSLLFLIATLMISLSFFFLNSIVVNGQTVSSQEKKIDDGTLLEITKENFLEHFQLNSAAKYNSSTGILTLTPDTNFLKGSATFNQKVNFNQDILIEGKVNIGNKSKPKGGGDGVALGFHQSEVNKIGYYGNGFGFAGLKAPFGFKIDVYHNPKDEPSIWSGKDPSRFVDNTFAGFFGPSPAPSGWLYTYDDSKSYGEESLPRQVDNPSENNFLPYKAHFNRVTHLFTIEFNGQVWKMPMEKLPKSLFDPSNPVAQSFMFSASTGSASNLQEFEIDRIVFSVPNYYIKKVDVDTNEPLSGAEFSLFKGTEQVLTDLTTNVEGLVKLPLLPSGDYLLRETKAPEGYYKIAKDIPISISENIEEDTGITVANEKKKDVVLPIKYVDSLTGKEFSPDPSFDAPLKLVGKDTDSFNLTIPNLLPEYEFHSVIGGIQQGNEITGKFGENAELILVYKKLPQFSNLRIEAFYENLTGEDKDKPLLYFEGKDKGKQIIFEKKDVLIGSDLISLIKELVGPKINGYELVSTFDEIADGNKVMPKQDLTLKVYYRGELKLTNVSKEIDFGHNQLITTGEKIINPLNELNAEILDTRGIDNSWKLMLSLSSEFTSIDNDKFLGEVAFNSKANSEHKVLSDQAQEVHKQITKENGVTKISWITEAGEGIHLIQYPGNLNKSYSSTLTWTLQDAL